MSDKATATNPGDGVVHRLNGDGNTMCGMSAVSWSREVTRLQELGLVVFCQDCENVTS
jgi:hypothetical protein